ncbi:MAG: PH domain-containing protein [Acidimicrobiales bacterium]
MAFPTKLLNDGEEVISDLHPHWSTLAGPVATVIGVLAVAILAYLWNTLAAQAASVVLLGSAAWLALRVARRNTTDFVLTTDRLVYRSGILAKHGKEIPLERVNDIAFRQSFFERVIGTGDLSIESAGAQSRETFADIPRPSVVQNEIYRQMEASAGRHADRMAGHREVSVPEQLEKLDELRQRGVISQAEFDAKKRQLLDRM